MKLCGVCRMCRMAERLFAFAMLASLLSVLFFGFCAVSLLLGTNLSELPGMILTCADILSIISLGLYWLARDASGGLLGFTEPFLSVMGPISGLALTWEIFGSSPMPLSDTMLPELGLDRIFAFLAFATLMHTIYRLRKIEIARFKE